MIWSDRVSGRYFLTMNAGSSNYLDSGQQPAVGEWQHLAATYDGSTARFFVNGTQVASQSLHRERRRHRRLADRRVRRDSLRVLRRPHRRGPDLRPRAHRVTDPGRHGNARRGRPGRGIDHAGERRDERERGAGDPGRLQPGDVRLVDQHDDRSSCATPRARSSRPTVSLRRGHRHGHAHTGRPADLRRHVHRDRQGRRRPASRAPAAARWPPTARGRSPSPRSRRSCS